MKRIIMGAVAGAALLTGVTAASAQYYSDEGSYYRGPMVERSVGLQVGPVGVYADGPSYYDEGGATARRTGPRARTPDVYNSRSFRAQEVWPQSPPGVGGN
jgi:hypothetical protein